MTLPNNIKRKTVKTSTYIIQNIWSQFGYKSKSSLMREKKTIEN